MKAKFGAIVVAGSGKVGGHVFSKNRGGAYMRTKVTPNNPQTVAQQNARALLSSLSTAWAELTEAQRLSWNGAVADYATTDIFGDLKNPSGFNLFIKLNANLSNAGLSTVNTAPAKEEIPYTTIETASGTVSPLTFDIDFGDSSYDGVALLVSATPALSAGKTNVNSEYRGIGVFTGAGGGISIAPEYVAKFGSLIAGGNISVRIEPVVASGQKGTPQTIKAEISA